LEYLACLPDDLDIAVHSVPKQIDMVVAQLKLNSLGVNIDELSDEQKKYLESWEEGT
jgi:adenosylhomocysteinase